MSHFKPFCSVVDLNGLSQVLTRSLGSEVGQLPEDLIASLGDVVAVVQVSVSSDSSGEQEILLHDGLSLGVDSAQVGVLEESDEVGLGSFLDCDEGLGSESDLVINALGDGPHESLEGRSQEEQGGRLLVSLDLSQGDGAGSESVSSNLSLNSSLGGGGLLADLASLRFGVSLGSTTLLTSFLSCDFISWHLSTFLFKI